MVTEWGPTGHWEGLQLLEIFNRKTSSEKKRLGTKTGMKVHILNG